MSDARIFHNCTYYKACAVTGRVWREDFRELRVSEGSYAQYDCTVHLAFLQPRKRRWMGRTLMPSTGYYVAIVPTASAPALESLGLPSRRFAQINMIGLNAGGVGGTPWLNEFEQKLKATGVSILAEFKYEDLEGDQNILSQKPPELDFLKEVIS